MSIGSTENRLSLEGNLIVEGEHDFAVAGGKLVPPQGTSFPSTTAAGEMFWRTDEKILYRRNDADTAWEAIQVDVDDLVFGVTGVVRFDSAGNKEQYADITSACAAASSGDVILVGPGTYAEAFTIPTGVQVRAASGSGSATISGPGPTGTRVTLGSQTVLQGFVVSLPTDATAGVYVPPGTILPTISELVLVGNGGSGIGIGCDFSAVMDRIRYASGACATIIQTTGAAAYILNGLLVLGGTPTTLIDASGGSAVVATEVYTANSPFFSCTDGLKVSDATILVSDSSLFKCTNAINVTDDAGVVLGRALRIQDCTNDLVVDSAVTNAEVRLTGCELSIDKINTPPAWLGSGRATLAFQDEKLDDEGYKLFGELQVGLPEQGRESVFGEGDSYTRGSLILTTDSTADATVDGGNLTDVTAAAQSADGSTFTFQGVTAGHAILMGSTLSSSADRLKFYGIKVKQVAAAVLNLGGTHDSFAFEYWDGTQWADTASMASESSLFYVYANEVFIRPNSSEHIRFGLDSKTSWAKKTINGQEAYWVRVRIIADVTTAPTFEQIKLSSSRIELNADGTAAMHGEARYRTSVIFAGNVWGESGGVGSTSPAVGSGGVPTGWNHNVKNSFLNTNGDAVYTQFPLPLGICTSCPIFLRFSLDSTATASDIDLICSMLPRESVGILEADPSGAVVPVARLAANTQQLTDDAAQTQAKTVTLDAGKSNVIEFGPFEISDYYAGDQVFIRLELDDDGTSNANILAYSMSAVGVNWTLGEHL